MKTTTCPANEAKLVTTLKGHAARVGVLAMSPDRCLLASASDDGTGRIWSVAGSMPGQRAILSKGGDRFHSLAFAPSSRKLAVGSGAANGLVWLFDVTEKEPQEIGTLRGPKGSVDALAYSADGKLIAGGGEDNTLRVWEPGTNSAGNPRTILVGHSRPITMLAFAPDGQSIATTSRDSTVRLWTIGRIWSKEKASLPHEGGATAVAFSNDGKTLATAGADRVIRLWDLTGLKPQLRTELNGHTAAIRVLLFAPDGKTLVSVGDGPKVFNWDLWTNSRLCEWQLPAVEVAGYALTGDGRYLAVGTTAGLVGVYRVAEKR